MSFALIKIRKFWRPNSATLASVFILQIMFGCGTAEHGDMTVNSSGEVTMLAVGDIMLSRTVARRMHETNDLLWPVRNITGELRKADIVFGNLEGAICEGRPVQSGEMVFHADPGAEVTLQSAHVNLLSLANNHFPDFGKRCMTESLTRLDLAGIAHAGAGNDMETAAKPAFIQRNGLRIAMLAFNDSDTVPASYFAGKDHAGTMRMDIPPAQKAVIDARKDADIVLVSMHAGWEYREVNPRQQKFARAMIDAGVDMVMGHHPHIVQKAEWYKGKLIVYSLGNFVFDQTWSEETQQSVMLKMVMDKNGVRSLQFVPISIQHAGQPEIMDDKKKRVAILGKLGLDMDETGTVRIPASVSPNSSPPQ